MRFRVLFSFIIGVLFLPASSDAAADPIADLIEKYVSEDGSLRNTESRLRFHPVPPHQILRIPANFNFRCGNGGGRSVAFEVKAGQSVHWGLKNSVSTGGVSFTQQTPRGAETTTIENHIHYKACRMDEELISAVLKLACDDRIAATAVIINSAFRDPITNLLEGGKSASQHLLCKAIDFSMVKNTRGQRNQALYERVPPALVQQVAASFQVIKGVGRGLTFTHADTRNGARAVWNYGPKVAENKDGLEIQIPSRKRDEIRASR